VAIQRQISNLQAGDLVVFIGIMPAEPDVMGFVIDDRPDAYDEQSVLIQFFGKHDLDPLHYYRRELDEFMEEGEIRVQHG
jgi:hypothetical protein